MGPSRAERWRRLGRDLCRPCGLLFPLGPIRWAARARPPSRTRGSAPLVLLARGALALAPKGGAQTLGGRWCGFALGAVNRPPWAARGAHWSAWSPRCGPATFSRAPAAVLGLRSWNMKGKTQSPPSSRPRCAPAVLLLVRAACSWRGNRTLQMSSPALLRRGNWWKISQNHEFTLTVYTLNASHDQEPLWLQGSTSSPASPAPN